MNTTMKPINQHHAELIAIADEWRAEHPEMAGHGYVLIYRGAVAGWTATLVGTAPDWVPGVRAVSVDGEIYVAAGGSDDRGAEGWARLAEAV